MVGTCIHYQFVQQIHQSGRQRNRISEFNEIPQQVNDRSITVDIRGKGLYSSCATLELSGDLSVAGP